MRRRLIVTIVAVVLSGCAPSTKAQVAAANPGLSPSCSQNPDLQKIRSAELQTIVDADQKDRENFQSLTAEQGAEVSKRDVERRKQVGEIFGEGCLKTAADFSAAALVYQHGDVPEHFYQTFIWSKRAVELGDEKQKSLMALGLDLYLVNIGQKQLFASQAFHGPGDSCFCLQSVEKSFPDSERIQYTHRGYADTLKWIRSRHSPRF